MFIYDMAGSNYTNFELDLSKKILNLLKVEIAFHCSLFAIYCVFIFIFKTLSGGFVFFTSRSTDLSLSLCVHQGAFPARLKKVLIVGAPVWFRVPYNLLSLLLKEKLRERVSAQTRAGDWPPPAAANQKKAGCSWNKVLGHPGHLKLQGLSLDGWTCSWTC